MFPPDSLKGLRLGVYQHSAVGRDLLVEVFSRLRAQVSPLHRSDTFIPVDTEALRPEDVQLARELARQFRFDAIVSATAGFAAGEKPHHPSHRSCPRRGDCVSSGALKFWNMNKTHETIEQVEPPVAGEDLAPGSEVGPVEEPPTTGESQPLVEAKTITLPGAEYEALKTKAAKADEHWDRLLRQAAELDNFKKRMARERQEAGRYAHLALLEKLVPILDNLDMALAAANNSQAATIESLRTGIALIYNQLQTILAEAGLEEIDAANKPFDPTWHEAVSQQESSDAPDGHVLQQLRKGYKLRDRLIRPAGVVVARKPAAS